MASANDSALRILTPRLRFLDLAGLSLLIRTGNCTVYHFVSSYSNGLRDSIVVLLGIVVQATTRTGRPHVFGDRSWPRGARKR